MTRADALLAILAAANGGTYTPVQIQKAVFLVTRNLPSLVDDGPGFNFVPYDYGPFDSDIYSEAEMLRDQGAAIIARSSEGRWKTYAASEAGLTQGKDILAGMPAKQREYVKSVSAWVRALTFSSLVKSIYDAYPEMRTNSIFRG